MKFNINFSNILYKEPKIVREGGESWSGEGNLEEREVSLGVGRQILDEREWGGKSWTRGRSGGESWSGEANLGSDEGERIASAALSLHEMDDELPTSTAVVFSMSNSQSLSRRTRLKGDNQFGIHGDGSYRTVYDVTQRETFTNLSNIWEKEVETYSTNPECIKILVGNKVDRENERAVSREEGMALAHEHKCLFLECSAKTRENVQQCFRDFTLKIYFLSERPCIFSTLIFYLGSVDVKRQILKQKQEDKMP
ncbi:unnamed protein product [Prunus brigantina]